ncbi:MAG: CO dehydrogenase/acetyl-CoA synthase complex subunit alpha [Methanocellales archaeon]|nr:CO dehydrogenase/acetyl-CoA synthase complex subunit alpha [Methanocellales archaeon]MDD3292263.1 CO dehydrogenase/acetyl-CoA synthase complex subunit alpha [Methanocellales archaeon]MDD5485851.1 CO dehydrogenase/acetyl-CoA synthase complex subunit alpha [Methanocellales archaeon]
MKKARFKVDELESDIFKITGLEATVGAFYEEWEEAPGPTPMPDISTFRDWDRILLNKYKPFYLPLCDLCCLCTMGKCDLSKGKKGACGLDMAAQQSRIVLLSCAIGAATHAGHGRHMVEELVSKFGSDYPLDVGGLSVLVEAPHTRLVTGIKPRTLGDLEDVLDYVEKEITHLLSCCHTGQEGDNIDFESKAFHAGMIDHVGMEICDLAQISALNFPKADPEASMVDVGMGSIDITKPVILVIGHNVPPAAAIFDYMEDGGLEDSIELAGICCTALDLTRYTNKAKIAGPLSHQLRFVRSGIADVIVVDEQCIRADILDEAKKVKAPLISTHYKNFQGLPNRTEDPTDEIVSDMVEGRSPGVVILDSDKAGEVAVRVAMGVFPKRKKSGIIPEESEIIEYATKCTKCLSCQRVCPNYLPLPEAMEAAAKGNLQPLSDLYESCIGCGRCEGEGVCPNELKLHSIIIGASRSKIKEERFKVRVGRGAISDTEIRRVGGPIVMGEIPGVIGIVGCSNYPGSWKDNAIMIEEFLKRRFIVTTTGCAAMNIGMYKNEDGLSLYEAYSGAFDAGGLVNCGSCVSNPHISGAAIKIASIFAKRKLNSNYEEIADYIHNRVGAVGISWGAMSQKASSIASGFWRLGIPVIVGPHGSKYRRALLGRKDKEENWYVIDARTGKRVYTGPAPEHLFISVETKEEAMTLIPKLCIRPNDTTKGRSIKLNHYIDLHKRFYGAMPDDIQLFVRTMADIPITMKDEILEILKEKGWKESEVPAPDPTLLPRLVRKKGDGNGS